MHRTLSVPRLIGCLSLLFALTLLIGLRAVPAQQPALGPNHSTIELAVGTSRSCQMTTRADLKRVENPNSNVVRVERVADKNNEVLLVAEHPGRTTITLTDQNNRVESHEVVVAAAAQPAGPLVLNQTVTINKGAFRSIRLREIPTGGVINENSKVVRVLKSESLDIFTLEGLDFGRTRVIFFAGPGKDRQEIFDVNVTDEQVLQGVHQVELHVVVAEVSRSEARNMSFSWNINGPNWFVSSLIGGPGTFASALTPGIASSSSALAGTPNLPYGVLNGNGSFMGFLQALRTENLGKVLAEPRVTTLSGRSGRILAGGQVPLILPGTAGSLPSIDYKDFGTVVNFLPIVKSNGKIYLEVRPEVSDIDSGNGVNFNGTVVPAFKTRSAQVSVEIEDGQTLAIGGLIQTKIAAQISRVPFLGDLPFVGVAFTSKSYKEDETELLILVTPRLVHPVDCTKIPHYLPGRETRSPDDFELFLEGILEAPRGQRNVVFHPHMYKPAFQNGPYADKYPCGNGNCYNGTGCNNGNCAPSHATLPTSGSNIAMPGPNFPDVPGLTTSNSRIVVEPEMPATLPALRDAAPSLGPLVPTTPTGPLPPARQQEPSRVLPPLSPMSR